MLYLDMPNIVPSPIIPESVVPLWAGRNATVEIQEIVINQPLSYIGTNLGLRWHAAINSEYPAKESGLAGRINAVTYQELTTRQRFHYLQWLASGRTSALKSDTFLYVFLANAELFLLNGPYATEVEETQHLLKELWDISIQYGTQFGVATHKYVALHDFCILRQQQGSKIRAYQNIEYIQPANKTPTPFLRYALGQLIQDDKRLTARWAYQWARCLMSKSEAQYVALYEPLFRKVFIHKFVQAYGEGLVLPTIEKDLLVAQYTPTNQQLPQLEYAIQEAVPLVRYWPEIIQPLNTLLYQTQSIFQKYCQQRLKGVPDAECWSYLPTTFWPAEHRQAFRELIEAALNQPQLVTYQQIAPYLYLPKDQPSKYLPQISQAFSKFGLTCYPPLSKSLKSTDSLILYQVQTADESARLNNEMLEVDLAIRLWLTEYGQYDTTWQVLSHILEPKPGQSITLAGQLQQVQIKLAQQNSLKKLTKVSYLKFDESLRAGAQTLVASWVAQHPEQPKTPTLDTLCGIAWRVEIRKPLVLDISRVHKLATETQQVQSLLGAIFVEEMLPAAAVNAPKASAKYAVLQTVSTKDFWSTEEFEQLAAQHGQMADGLAEWANDQSVERGNTDIFENADAGWHVNTSALNLLLQADG